MKKKYIFIHCHQNYDDVYRMRKLIYSLSNDFKFVFFSIPETINKSQNIFKKTLLDLNIDFDEISYNKTKSFRYVIDGVNMNFYRKTKTGSIGLSLKMLIDNNIDNFAGILVLKYEDDDFLQNDLFVKAINNVDNTKYFVNIYS